jgi:hypothetical protein
MGINDFHIGLMNKRGMLQKNVQVDLRPGKSPAKKDVFEEVVTTKGYLYEGKGRRTLSSGEIVFDAETTFRVRFQDAIWNVLTTAAKKSLKWIIEGRVFTVQGWNKVQEKNCYIDFVINEQR